MFLFRNRSLPNDSGIPSIVPLDPDRNSCTEQSLISRKFERGDRDSGLSTLGNHHSQTFHPFPKRRLKPTAKSRELRVQYGSCPKTYLLDSCGSPRRPAHARLGEISPGSTNHGMCPGRSCLRRPQYQLSHQNWHRNPVKPV